MASFSALCCFWVVVIHLHQVSAECDPTAKYRTYDGSCNNLDHPERGQAGAVFKRLLPPAYEDEKQVPRLYQSDGTLLPNVRNVSVLMHDPGEFYAPGFNQWFMSWGQFLDHDITRTPKDGPGYTCCSEDLVINGDADRVFDEDELCWPIIIPENDTYFKDVEYRCKEFYRSNPYHDENGVRQQYNELSAYIDGSQIYGESETLAGELRTFSRGKLKTKKVGDKDFLPRDDDNSQCFKETDIEYCFKAGDKRVNTHIGLSALHTIFVRYHNLISGRLTQINKLWEDEDLYQETRRIIIAILQSITQNEYLSALFPKVVGIPYVDLLVEDVENYKYDSSIDATLPNVFSAAAFRFGHSQLSGNLTLGGTLYLTQELFKRSEPVLTSLKDVVEGQMNEPAFRTDRWYTDALTNHWDEKPEKPQSGWDLASLNIQRGRDHGLQPINKWRDHYGLKPIESFDHISSGKNRLPKLYATIDDVDVYTAGLAEDPMPGSRVGEVFTWIISETFHDLKYGDRFWYENTDPGHDSTRFSKEQITEISKITLSKVVCDTVDDIDLILPDLFKLEGENRGNNVMKNCTELDDINLELWRV